MKKKAKAKKNELQKKSHKKLTKKELGKVAGGGPRPDFGGGSADW